MKLPKDAATTCLKRQSSFVYLAHTIEQEEWFLSLDFVLRVKRSREFEQRRQQEEEDENKHRVDIITLLIKSGWPRFLFAKKSRLK